MDRLEHVSSKVNTQGPTQLFAGGARKTLAATGQKAEGPH